MVLGACLALYALAPALSLSLVGAWAFFLLAIWRPRAALVLVPATLPLYLLPRALGSLEISLPETTLLLSAAAIGTRLLADRLRGAAPVLRLRPTPFDGPAALFLAAALLSLLVTQYVRLSLRELRTVILEPLLFFYLAAWLAPQPRQARRLVEGLLIGAAGAALLGLGQYALNVGTTEIEGVRRVSALYQSPNNLALLLGRALPFALAGALLLGGWRRLGYGAAFVALALADAVTFSVGGWLGAAAGLAVVLLGLGRRALLWGALAAAGGLLAAVPLLQVERVVSHLNATGASTTFVRLQLWQASLAMLRDHPILGIGLDNFLYLYRQEYLPPGASAEPNLSHPHNLVLHFWLALGLPGLAAFLWLLWTFVRCAWRRATASLEQRLLALGALGSMADCVVHGLGDNSYFLVDLAFCFWLTLAAAHAASRQASEQEVQEHGPAP